MSPHLLRVAAWFVGLISAALVANAGFECWHASNSFGIRVEVADCAVHAASPGQANSVEYVLINDGSDPVRLLGGDARCFANCCFGPKLDDLPTIPPGGQASVPYELFVRTPGEPFAAESTLFLQCHGQVISLRVTVSGTALVAAPR